MAACVSRVELSVSCRSLLDRDLGSRSDPLCVLLQDAGGGRCAELDCTEKIKNCQDPEFGKKLVVDYYFEKVQKLKFSMYDIDNKSFDLNDDDFLGGIECTLGQVQCDSDGSHDLIGTLETTLAKMQTVGAGSLTETEYSFLDYVMGGYQINFMVGIDFTASSGDPKPPDSFYWISSDGINEYLIVIWSVRSVVQDYDKDKLFPAFGFGAQVPPSWQVSHEFALNFKFSNPCCQGIQGIVGCLLSDSASDLTLRANQLLSYFKPHGKNPKFGLMLSAYREHINALLVLIGTYTGLKPSYFNEEPVSNQQYFILLIITDGEITDLDQTRQVIVNASQLPMSIIIIVVDEASFKAMEFLDGDSSVLRSVTNEPAAWDVIQFVPFRQFKNAPQEALSQMVWLKCPSS